MSYIYYTKLWRLCEFIKIGSTFEPHDTKKGHRMIRFTFQHLFIFGSYFLLLSVKCKNKKRNLHTPVCLLKFWLICVSIPQNFFLNFKQKKKKKKIACLVSLLNLLTWLQVPPPSPINCKFCLNFVIFFCFFFYVHIFRRLIVCLTKQR